MQFSRENLTKMWELWAHPDYDHFYIQLTSKEGKFQSQANIFPLNNNPFSIKPTVVRVKMSENKTINFLDLKSLYFFQKGPNNGLKMWIFDATKGYFQIKLPLVFILQMKR